MHMLGARRSEAYAGTHHSTIKMCLQLCAEGQKDLPARGHREDVSGMAFSHRLHDRAAQQHGRSARLRQRFHARNVFRDQHQQAVPPYYNAILAQSMRAQHASNTTARANYHTRLPSFKRLAIAWSDMRLATQTIKPAVRGAHGTCL